MLVGVSRWQTCLTPVGRHPTAFSGKSILVFLAIPNVPNQSNRRDVSRRWTKSRANIDAGYRPASDKFISFQNHNTKQQHLSTALADLFRYCRRSCCDSRQSVG